MAPWSLILALSLAAPGAEGAIGFANGGGLCSATDGTTVFLGKQGDSQCKDGSLPEEYIGLNVVALALLKGETAYLDDDEQFEVINPTPDKNFVTMEEVEVNAGNETAKFAMVNSGSLMGDVDSGAFGFVGTASYLLTEGELMYNTNNFKYLTPGSDTPQEADDICVVPLVGSECGDKRTATPGTYKFSLYGYTAGDGFAGFITAGAFTHMGVRQLVDVTNMGTGVTVSFNGEAATAVDNIAMGSTGLTEISISGEKTSLSFKFETKFNVGSVTEDGPVPSMTKTVKIHAVKGSATHFFIDYIFDLEDELDAKDGYFVYDPEISLGEDPEDEDVDSDSACLLVQTIVPFLALGASLTQLRLY